MSDEAPTIHDLADRAIQDLTSILGRMRVDLGAEAALLGRSTTDLAKVYHHSLEALRAGIANHRIVAETATGTTLLGHGDAVTSYRPQVGRLTGSTEVLSTHPVEQG